MTVDQDQLTEVPEAVPSWLRRWMPHPADEVGVRRFSWLIGALLVLGFVAFLTVGGNNPPDPSLDRSTARSSVKGFDQLGFRVRASPLDDRASELSGAVRCALLADSPDQWSKGLSGRNNLSGYDAMLFRFPENMTTAFHMRGVSFALSIAWFDDAGRFIAQTEMAPCGANAETCPTYQSPTSYRYAIETRRGKLDALGIGPQSTLLLAGVCPPRRSTE